MIDEEIIGLVQKGNKDQYGEIIERYQRKISRYLRQITNQSDEIVEDLTEETLIKAYENLRDFDCKKKFSNWIYRIAHNKAIDFFRKSRTRRFKEWEEEYIEDGGKLLEDELIEIDSKMELIKAIERLEIKHKEVIWLYYFEDKSYNEISDILRISPSNVGVILVRAKDRLKRFMKQDS